jgi:cytochrome c-type biogenesis protein CcmH/NrfG
MGWLLIVILAAVVLLALWRFGRFDRAALQFVGAGLLLAMAGYAWQGRPGLPAKLPPPPVRQQLPESEFAENREAMLGRFDSAAQWLTLAESYQRSGDTRSGVGIIRSGLRKSPRDADLWVGLGNALVIHADGMMTPSAELAFRRAAEIAPEHPGPKFFYGLALAQGGKFDEAEAIWREILETAPPDASWRPMVEERLAMIGQLRGSSPLPPAGGAGGGPVPNNPTVPSTR